MNDILSPANLNIPDNLIDRAYDVMSEELGHWQVIGPQRGRVLGGMERDFFTAARAPDQLHQTPAVVLPNAPAPAELQEPHFQHFKDKAYAIAYVQWNGLKAVLADAEVQLGIIKLAE